MKKLLLIITLCFVSITSFAQLTKEAAYRIFGSDWTRIADYEVKANMKDSTMTFTHKKTKFSQTFPINQIPKRYFLQIHSEGKQDFYSHMDILVFINEGKYGVIDKYCKICDEGEWDVNKYDVYEYHDGVVMIEEKGKKSYMTVNYYNYIHNVNPRKKVVDYYDE